MKGREVKQVPRARTIGKLLVWPLLTILMIGVLSACTGTGKDRSSLSAVQVGERIEQAVPLNEMKTGDADKLQKLYQLDSGNIENFVLYTAPTNVKAEELAVIQVKDSQYIDTIKANILQRVEQQGKSFKDYVPAEYYLIEKHVLKSKGNFILFVISKDADQVEKAFDEALK